MTAASEEKPGKLIAGMFRGLRETDIEEKTTYCAHERHGYTVSERERTVTCNRCNATLDPFDVMIKYANNERVWRNWSGEADKARVEVGALREEAKRLKAQMRSASRKDADAAVAAYRKRIVERVHQLGWKTQRLAELGDEINRFLDAIVKDDAPLTALPPEAPRHEQE